MPRRIAVLFAHPRLEKSRINRALLAGIRDLPGVTVRDLYELYPDLEIDVAAEQAMLLEHDAILFQHPFYWYSVPAILKQWQDWVLEHGWAYGAEGKKLEGKITMQVVTTGGPERAYQPEGYNRFTVRALLAPWEATARLCRMRYLAPFIVHGTHRLVSLDDVAPHVRDYRRFLELLRDERIDLDRAATLDRINADLDAITKGA
ncbi:NAD(P)H-dependent oxidoreductase [Myxococcota bacterium]|nr:NAD(P)H-dependent oxidoreductase [Myxococcota bacterium]